MMQLYSLKIYWQKRLYMLNYEQRLQRAQTHLLESAAVKRALVDSGMELILAAADLVVDAFRTGGKLLLCGNGGSAADCQHMAAEFTSRLTRDFDRPALPAIALTTDTSFLTAYANDSNFDGVFARQVEALGKAGDVLIGISTSGGSPNVLRAVEIARERRMSIIALTGCAGRLLELADIAIAVPSSSTHYIQEAH